MENIEKEKYLQQIDDIKHIMESNAKFLSLSGISGIWAGFVALLASFIVLCYFPDINEAVSYISENNHNGVNNVAMLLVIAIFTLIASLVGGYVFTSIKAQKLNHTLWNATTRKITFELFFILATGGIFCLIQMYNGIYFLTAPTTLLFYGIGLFSISKYTVRDIKYLAILMCLLGLANTLFLNAGILFWTFGFGVLHIIYGTSMYYKYDRN